LARRSGASIHPLSSFFFEKKIDFPDAQRILIFRNMSNPAKPYLSALFGCTSKARDTANRRADGAKSICFYS
jgi:hypothetical protein